METNKDILLKDISARLPYGVKLDCKWKTPAPNGTYGMICTMDSFLLDQICNIDDIDVPFDEVKPYLFPLSSITEEQREEHQDLINNHYNFDANGNVFTLQDFYCKYHFDYRGFIEKGLAIDATELNIY